MKEVMHGEIEGKRNYLFENERYGNLKKRRAEDRQEWRVWLPGTCRVAENLRS